MEFGLKKLGLIRSSKILSITHAFCLDGTCSQIVIENVFKDVNSIACKYDDMDKELEYFLQPRIYENYDFIFITDISPKDPDLLKGKNKIILLDHHNTASCHHNKDENKYVIPEKFSGSSLTKKFCEDYFGKKLKHLDNLIKYSEDYDLWIKRYPKSTFLNELHFKYFSEGFKKRFFDGNTRFTNEEISFLRSRKQDFEYTFKSLDIYELHKIKGAYVQSESGKFVNEIAEKLLKDGYNIVFVRNQSQYKNSVSVRCKKGFVDIGTILKTLGIGGGHAEAAGFVEPDFMMMKSKIEDIEKFILLEMKGKK